MRHLESGYVAVTFIIFIAITVIITTASAIIFSMNALNETRAQQGMGALYLAESGLEKGLIGYLRDPAGYLGETITFPNGTTIVNISGGTMTSIGQVGSFTRVVEAQMDYTTKLTVKSWREIWP